MRDEPINIEKTRRKDIYKDTLKYFEYTILSKGEFEKIKKQIDRAFKKDFPDRVWSDLSDNEKCRFYVTSMERYMLRNTKLPFPDKIERKIKSEIQHLLVEGEKEGKLYNQHMDALFIKDPQTKRRPYDDMMSAIYDDQIERQNKYYPALEILQTKIDVILKVLKDEFGYEVDVKEIEKSLVFYHNFERGDLEPLQLHSDGKELSEEERNREQALIDENKMFLHYNKKIRDLDFITYVGDQ
nr:hypothetical protein [Streptococcus gallolyticus]